MKKYFTFAFIISGSFIFSQLTSPLKWDLNTCIEYAVTHNLNIKKAILEQDSYENSLKYSRNSRLPNLIGEVGEAYSGGVSVNSFTGSSTYDAFNTSFSASTQIILFNGSKINNQIAQNKILVNRSKFFIDQSKDNIILNLLQQYIEAIYYKESIEIAINNYTTTKKELEQTELKVKKGALAKKDLADMQAQFANDEYKIITEKTNYEQKIFAIKQLLEVDPRVSFSLIVPDLNKYESRIVPSQREIYELAINNLAEVKTRSLDITAKERGVKIAQADYYPTLILSGALATGYYSTQKEATGFIYDENGDPIDYKYSKQKFEDQLNDNLKKQVSVALQIPIFNRFSTKANVNQAKIELEQAKIDYHLGNKELYKNIEMTWLNYTSNQGEIRANLAAKNAAQLSFELAQAKYEYGDISITDLLISQKNFTNAQQQYLQSKFMGILYYQLLEYYQGNKINL